MAFIYDLDNEGGGTILADSNTVAPALKINSNAAGYPALAIQSTASGAAVQVSGIQGIGIDADAKDANAVAGDFRSLATTGRAVIVGRTVAGSPTIAPMQFLHPSCASAAVMEFGGGFISCTSIDIVTAANSDYVLPVSLNGVVRYIPLVNSTAIQSGAAFE